MRRTEDGWVQEDDHEECPSCGVLLINTLYCPYCDGDEGWD